MRNDHTPDTELIVRFLGFKVEERADDVASAVAEEEDGVCDDFLGVA